MSTTSTNVSPGKLIPFGYSMPGAESILASLMESDPRILLVDIRSRPYSNRVAWQQRSLESRYGTRYRFLGGLLGNVNYNNGGPIKLADTVAGVKRLLSWLEAGYSLVILCACREYELCHRAVVVEKMREKCPDIEVEEVENMRFNEWRPVAGYLPALSASQLELWG